MGDRIRPSKSSSAGRLLERGEAPTPKHSYFILVGESWSIEYSLSGPKWKSFNIPTKPACYLLLSPSLYATFYIL